MSVWTDHVKAYAAANNCTYKEAMTLAKDSYVKVEKSEKPAKVEKSEKPVKVAKEKKVKPAKGPVKIEESDEPVVIDQVIKAPKKRKPKVAVITDQTAEM
jgi:hypothetical protein